MPQRYFVALVLARRPCIVGREKSAPACASPPAPRARRNPVHVHVQRRHEDADSLKALAGGRIDLLLGIDRDHAAVGGRDHEALRPAGISRSGSRKNEATKSVSARSARPTHHQPSTSASSAADPSTRRTERLPGRTSRASASQFFDLSTSRCEARNGIIPRRRAPTFSIGWCSASLRSSLKVRAAATVLGEPLVGERAD